MHLLEWPREWYRFIDSQFNLTTMTLGTRAIFTPRRNTRLSYQIFTMQATYAAERGPSKWQGKEAFFARLDGEVGVFRIGDMLRCQPKYNREHKVADEPWSDSTLWTDGTGWIGAGLVPPSAQVRDAAALGDKEIVIEGLPANIAGLLAPGDLFEIRPNGIATTTSNLYEIVRANSTDADGAAGVEIRPRLRQGFAAGDMVVFHDARGSFMLTDSDQGTVSRDANFGSFGFAAREYVG